MSKFDTTSPTLRGKQTWRFCIQTNSYEGDYPSRVDQSFRHYIEISDTYQSLRSDRMVTKNICLRMNDEQLAMMKNILDVYFEEEEE